MQVGRVVGKLWATRKDEKLNGIKFLVVRLLKNETEENENIFVVADGVGAGTGDLVMITKGGSARAALGLKDVPVDSTIVAIIDSLEVDDA